MVVGLRPDSASRAEVWNAEIRDRISEGNLLMFAHGFSIWIDED